MGCGDRLRLLLEQKRKDRSGGYHPLGDSAWWHIHLYKEEKWPNLCQYTYVVTIPYKLIVPFSHYQVSLVITKCQ